MRSKFWLIGGLAAVLSSSASAGMPEITSAIATIQKVGKEGDGNEAAASAWKTLAAQGVPALVPMLDAFATASPSAQNWLRSSIDAIADAEASAKRPLPKEELYSYTADRAKPPVARRIAYELLKTTDADAARRILETMTNDNSLELRRDAIAAELGLLKFLSDKSKIIAGHKKLFALARDIDQIQEIAKLLEADGEKPDVIAQLGLITRWQAIGPFDSPTGNFFATPMAPEQPVNLSAELTGKADAKLRWKFVESTDPQGTIDLNATLGKHKNIASYVYAVVDSPKEQAVDLRAATQNAIQIFVNGKKIFEREEYHHGTKLDQHIAKGTLKAGPNTILVKVCQNNQTEQWAQAHTIQLRVCDSLGGAVGVTTITPEK